MVGTVKHPYGYWTIRQVRYDINTDTGHFGKLGTTSISVPRIPVPYRTHPCKKLPNKSRTAVKYRIYSVHIPPVYVRKSLTVPVPLSARRQYRYRTLRSVSSVRHQYRHRTFRKVRHDINTGSRYFGKFGATSILVPDTSVTSARHLYRHRAYTLETI